MKRRSFLSMSAAAGATLSLRSAFGVQAPTARAWSSCGSHNLLILVELKGGNDGLNTVIPFADPAYYNLRKNICIKREHAIALDERTALHPSLLPLMPLWRNRQLAVVQGVGYAQPNLSHFRSTEIWDTASRSDQYLREGWLTRAFAQMPVPAGLAADGVVIGNAEMGPFANGERAIALGASTQPGNASRLASPAPLHERNVAGSRIFDVGNEIGNADDGLRAARHHVQLNTVFPGGVFGSSVKAAMQMLAECGTLQEQHRSGRGVAAIRLTLSGFDTHHNQPAQQAVLLGQLAEGLASMKAALVELGRWDRTLVMTYAEFGRRAQENHSNGTEHGTVAPHFVMGARVRGGLYGLPPALARLDGNGDLPLGVDFRQLYATVLGSWWGLDASTILQQRFEPLPLLRV
ncbi:DUF1501 domain-containing protein [Paraburkholderia sp. RL18-103-BIB-C]|jgi:uncharacterized protein (DUF1501 family)|uniref:DUF1501 domain-containing protein n=1 Tax=unclassified Paraburkholderia TaxID=2615204 RepID=UPI002F4D309C